MKTASEAWITSTKTAADWQRERDDLVPGNTAAWKAAVDEYFHRRVEERYLKPLRVLLQAYEKDDEKSRGEGFAILAVQCTLIEFLESTMQGKNYVYKRKTDPPLGQDEYSNSGDMFAAFLHRRAPFCDFFKTTTLADDFYKNVRCPLLHEARTKGKWRVWAGSSGSPIIDEKKKIVFRNAFFRGLQQFVKWYVGEVPSNPDLQAAFKKKFEAICT